jgi:hypothetical protein
MYQQNGSVPYTHSSNLIAALLAALHTLDRQKGLTLNRKVKSILIREGIEFLDGDSYSPGIITLPLSRGMSSIVLGDNLKSKNIFLSYESDYLIERNWVQLAIMGEYQISEVLRAMDQFIEEYNNSKIIAETVQ